MHTDITMLKGVLVAMKDAHTYVDNDSARHGLGGAISALETILYDCAVAVGAWLPISEAPRDGSLIKCKGNEGRDYYARWAWSANAGVNAWCGEVMGIVLPITPPPAHWMPIGSNGSEVTQ